MYKIAAHIIAVIHLIVIILNALALPFLIVNQPWYISIPIITFLVNPMVGGSYCMFNKLECFFRIKAGMPIITDRLEALFGKN